MSGGGGSSGSSSPAPAQTVAAPIQPVPQAQYDVSLGSGPTSTPQTYTQQGKPSWTSPEGRSGSAGYDSPWMQSAWDMPNWGKDAVTGKPLHQKDLQYQAPDPVAPTSVPEPTPTVAPTQEEYIPSGMMDLDVRAINNINNGSWTVAQANEASKVIRDQFAAMGGATASNGAIGQFDINSASMFGIPFTPNANTSGNG